MVLDRDSGKAAPHMTKTSVSESALHGEVKVEGRRYGGAGLHADVRILVWTDAYAPEAVAAILSA